MIRAEVKFERLVRQRGLQQLGLTRLELFAIHPDPAIAADETQAVALAVGVEDRDDNSGPGSGDGDNDDNSGPGGDGDDDNDNSGPGGGR